MSNADAFAEPESDGYANAIADGVTIADAGAEEGRSQLQRYRRRD
jgi:hypothetical protein